MKRDFVIQKYDAKIKPQEAFFEADQSRSKEKTKYDMELIQISESGEVIASDGKRLYRAFVDWEDYEFIPGCYEQKSFGKLKKRGELKEKVNESDRSIQVCGELFSFYECPKFPPVEKFFELFDTEIELNPKKFREFLKRYDEEIKNYSSEYNEEYYKKPKITHKGMSLLIYEGNLYIFGSFEVTEPATRKGQLDHIFTEETTSHETFPVSKQLETSFHLLKRDYIYLNTPQKLKITQGSWDKQVIFEYPGRELIILPLGCPEHFEGEREAFADQRLDDLIRRATGGERRDRGPEPVAIPEEPAPVPKKPMKKERVNSLSELAKAQNWGKTEEKKEPEKTKKLETIEIKTEIGPGEDYEKVQENQKKEMEVIEEKPGETIEDFLNPPPVPPERKVKTTPGEEHPTKSYDDFMEDDRPEKFEIASFVPTEASKNIESMTVTKYEPVSLTVYKTEEEARQESEKRIKAATCVETDLCRCCQSEIKLRGKCSYCMNKEAHPALYKQLNKEYFSENELSKTSFKGLALAIGFLFSGVNQKPVWYSESQVKYLWELKRDTKEVIYDVAYLEVEKEKIVASFMMPVQVGEIVNISLIKKGSVYIFSVTE